MGHCVFFGCVQPYVYLDSLDVQKECSLPSVYGSPVLYLLLVAVLGHDYLLINREQLYHVITYHTTVMFCFVLIFTNVNVFHCRVYPRVSYSLLTHARHSCSPQLCKFSSKLGNVFVRIIRYQQRARITPRSVLASTAQ